MSQVKIFVSYSRKDAGDFAEKVRTYFTSFKYEVFTDIDSISAGDDWNRTIGDNISTCDFFVVIVTYAALFSPHVDNEVLQAKREKKRIIPCIHRNLKKSDIKWDLNKIQGVEFDDRFELARNLYHRIAKNKNTIDDGGNISRVKKKFLINKWLLLALILVAVIGTGVLIISKHQLSVQLQRISPPLMFTYQNTAYGVKMQYPSDWILNETMQDGKLVRLHTPQVNSKNHYIAEVRLGTVSYGSSNLTDASRNEINGYDPTDYPHFRVVSSNTNSTLSGQPAYKFVYDLTPTSYGIRGKGVETGTIVGSNVYYIVGYTDADQYSSYMPIIQKMINSFTLFVKTKNPSSEANSTGASPPQPLRYQNTVPQPLRYQNTAYGVKMQYPSDWILNETKDGERFAQFSSQQTHSVGGSIATVNLGIANFGSTNLTDGMRNEINTYDPSDFPKFRILDSNANSSLAGLPAHKFSFEYVSTAGIPTRGSETGVIVDSDVYWINGVIDADQYSKYMPIIQRMINSYRLSIKG